MSSLADLPELVGFFSYSREDDEDSDGALSRLRDRIHRELGSQLGRSRHEFRLWQDKSAIAHGTFWENEIKTAVAQAVFFIPIVTPRAMRSQYCGVEFKTFLERERELGRDDLVFPILYIRVPALEDERLWRDDPIVSVVAKRQYLDWQQARHRSFTEADVAQKIDRFCHNIADALRKPWVSPEERKAQEEVVARRQAETETERQRQKAEAHRAADEEARQRAAEQARQKHEAHVERTQIAALEANAHEDEAEQRAEAERRRANEGGLPGELEVRRRAEEEERGRLRASQARPSRLPLAAGLLLGVVLVGAIGAWLALSPTPAPVAPPGSTKTPASPAPTPAPPAARPAAGTAIPGLSVAFGDTIDKVRSTYNIQGGPTNYCDAGKPPCFKLEVGNGLSFYFEHDEVLSLVQAVSPFSGSIGGVHIGDGLRSLPKPYLVQRGSETSTISIFKLDGDFLWCYAYTGTGTVFMIQAFRSK